MNNRIIKFRARRIDDGRWVYGSYFKTPLTDEDSGTSPDKGWFFLTGELRHCIANENGAVFIIDPETLGQFTGLRDKNGKEIYEGDILGGDGTQLIKEFQVEVLWGLDGWGYREIFKPDSTFIAFNDRYAIKPYYFSVVGNCFESNHLLPEAKQEK